MPPGSSSIGLCRQGLKHDTNLYSTLVDLAPLLLDYFRYSETIFEIPCL
jgi:hypothetical protein